MSAQPSPPSTALTSLPALPLDILLNIIPLLAKAELVKCTQVSRAINTIAIPLLYEKLNVDPSVPKSLSVFAMEAPKAQPKAHKALAVATTRRGMDVGLGLLQGGLGEIRRPNALPDRFAFVTYLAINIHTRDLCHNITSPILPNLITLRVLKGGFDLCLLNPSSSAKWRAKAKSSLCSLIAKLHPRRIIIGSSQTSLFGSADGLSTTDRPFPPTSVEEVAVMVGAQAGLNAAWGLEARLLAGLPGRLDRLTFIMQPETEKGMMVANAMMGGQVPGSRSWSQNPTVLRHKHARFFMAGLADACTGEAGIISIVGLETVDLDRTASSTEVKSVALRDEVERRLRTKGWSAAGARARVDGIKFVALKDYEGEKE